MTPVPTSASAPDKGAGQPDTLPPTPQPADPWQLVMDIYRGEVNTRSDTSNSTIIISGTVAIVAGPRWTTTDGLRPPNPHAQDNTFGIFRPVVVVVDKYLKGTGGQLVYLRSAGGTLGLDTVTWASDDTHTFQVGDRVIVFADEVGPQLLWPRDQDLSQEIKELVTPPEGVPWSTDVPTLHRIQMKYTIQQPVKLNAAPRAINTYRDVPLQQLLTEISTALGQ
jgi:hypothetical protein